MKVMDLYSSIDKTLGAVLREKAFVLVGEGDYRREDREGGFDRICFDADGRKRRFWALLSHYPESFSVMKDLLPEGHELGFPCGPYLTPAGVFPRGGGWSFKDDEVFEQAMKQIDRALEKVGFPWLERLRDPEFLAESVDRKALLASGLALEACGDFTRAREYYGELMSRFLAIIRENKTDKYVLQDMGKQFVFVAEKLGVEAERVSRFRQALGFDRAVSRCPTR